MNGSFPFRGLSLLGCILIGWTGLVGYAAPVAALDENLKQITFEQKLGQSVSMDLPFLDEEGRTVSLSAYFHGQPIILVPGYYSCPMLCGALANGLVNALRDVPMTAGKDFTVVHFSIDPHETPTLAAQKKRSYLKAYAGNAHEDGWHFLTGTGEADRKLADEIGFQYLYDAESKQYAHPSGFVVLTPGGRISHYFFGVDFSARELRQALADAGGGSIGTRLQQFILLCFHYQPVTGRYGAAAMFTLRSMALAVLLSLGGWIIGMVRSEKGKPANPSL